jgi:hypothetical protein
MLRPGPGERPIGISRLEVRVEQGAEVCAGEIVVTSLGRRLMGLDLAPASTADAEPGPRQYLQPF